MCPPERPNWITSVGPPTYCERCGTAARDAPPELRWILARGPFLAEDLADRLPKDGEIEA